MSHISDMKLRITDIEALVRAAHLLGLEVRQQTSYKWFGTFVGDAPLPEGFTKEMLGKCSFALGVPHNKQAYEVGVVKAPDGNGYLLHYDYWKGGYGLCDKIGAQGEKLVKEYVFSATEQRAARIRQSTERVKLEGGWERCRVRV